MRRWRAFRDIPQSPDFLPGVQASYPVGSMYPYGTCLGLEGIPM